MSYFTSCTALITGASSGIGEEFARQLAPRASTLILAARRTERLENLKSVLGTQHPSLRIHTYSIDLSQRDQIGAFVEWLAREGLQLDLLINNAGLGDHGPFERGSWEKIERMLDVNIGALTHLTHSLLPALHQHKRAAILNISSSASFIPIPDMAVYAATKAYVTSFSEALRAELRGTGISVTALCPGPVSTEFGQVAQREDGTHMPAPDFLKVPVEQVVHEALEAVAKGRARVIPGLLMAALMGFARFLPMFVLRPFLRSRH